MIEKCETKRPIDLDDVWATFAYFCYPESHKSVKVTGSLFPDLFLRILLERDKGRRSEMPKASPNSKTTASKNYCHLN